MSRLNIAAAILLACAGSANAQNQNQNQNQNQLRLGLGSTAGTSMMVTWVTSLADRDNDGEGNVVFYADSTEFLVSGNAPFVKASSQSYNVTDFVRVDYEYVGTDVYVSPYIHHAELVNLQPKTTYFYQVTVESGQLSPVYNFTTTAPPGEFPAAGSPSMAFVVGDLGQTQHSRNTINAIQEHRGYASLAGAGHMEFGILVGDMSYADGNSSRWETWGEMMQPLCSRMPMTFGVGNHEIESDMTPGRQRVPFTHYRNRFRMPGDYDKEVFNEQPPQYFDNWMHNYNFSFQYEFGASFYSYEVGLVHYVMLNSYNTYCTESPDCPQVQFLRSDLASVDRSVTPWVVVTMHAPFYNSNTVHTMGSEVATELQKTWAEPLLNEYGVNFVFAGHVHAYERFGSIDANGNLDPTGKSPIYVTIGDGGNRESLYDTWDDIGEGLSAFENGLYYGYGTLTFFNATAAKWEWRPNPYDGTALDAVAAFNHFSEVQYNSPGSYDNVISPTDLGDAIVASIVSAVLLVVIAVGVGVGFVIHKSKSRKRYTQKPNNPTTQATVDDASADVPLKVSREGQWKV